MLRLGFTTAALRQNENCWFRAKPPKQLCLRVPPCKPSRPVWGFLKTSPAEGRGPTSAGFGPSRGFWVGVERPSRNYDPESVVATAVSKLLFAPNVAVLGERWVKRTGLRKFLVPPNGDTDLLK